MVSCRASVKVSPAIPVYNELATLKASIQRVTAVDFDKELIIVDDGSTDGSREALSELAEIGLAAWLPDPAAARGRNAARVHLQPKNMGKGAALRAVLALVTADI